MLDADLKMKFEVYEDGRSRPKAKGSTWRRAYATATISGPYAAAEQGEDGDNQVDVHYKEGATELRQVWTKRPPSYVAEDRRRQERFRARTSLPLSKTNTFEKVLFNCGLLLDFDRELVRWFNTQLPANQQTTLGEVVKFHGLLAVTSMYPGIAFEDLWQETARPGQIGPIPNFGRFGMSKERAKTWKRMHQKPFDPTQSGFDFSDPNRYVRPLIEAFN